MTADYVPQVGDRVRVQDETAIVLGIDDDVAWVKWEHDSYRTTVFVGYLTEVTPPVVHPERWINVYPDGVYDRAWDTRTEADTHPYHTRIAVIHLAADGTLTLHPVERQQ